MSAKTTLEMNVSPGRRLTRNLNGHSVDPANGSSIVAGNCDGKPNGTGTLAITVTS